MVALTMMALALSEDSIRLRPKRNGIIDALGVLPDQIREVRQGTPAPFPSPGLCGCVMSCSTDDISSAMPGSCGVLQTGMWQPAWQLCAGECPRKAAAEAGCLPLQVLKLDAEMLSLAEQLKEEQSLLVFGRGYNYATALEAALKAWTQPSALLDASDC